MTLMLVSATKTVPRFQWNWSLMLRWRVRVTKRMQKQRRLEKRPRLRRFRSWRSFGRRV